jgi:hypothetical protein
VKTAIDVRAGSEIRHFRELGGARIMELVGQKLAVAAFEARPVEGETIERIR